MKEQILNYINNNKTGVTLHDILFNASGEKPFVTDSDKQILIEELRGLIETGMVKVDKGIYYPSSQSEVELNTDVNTEPFIKLLKERIKELTIQSKSIEEHMEKIDDLDSELYKTLEIEELNNNGALSELHYLLRTLETPKREKMKVNEISEPVKLVSKKELNKVIDTREPQGAFYMQEGDVWIGIDNKTGDAWTEEFQTLEDALRWLGYRLNEDGTYSQIYTSGNTYELIKKGTPILVSDEFTVREKIEELLEDKTGFFISLQENVDEEDEYHFYPHSDQDLSDEDVEQLNAVYSIDICEREENIEKAIKKLLDIDVRVRYSF